MTMYSQMDYMHNELSKEVENGRLFRLICKLGFINERPEYHGMDVSRNSCTCRSLVMMSML
jgi:hypothetical protein